MRLTKTEKTAVLLTALFLVFTAGIHAGRGGSGDGLYMSRVQVQAQEDAPLDGTVEVSDGLQPSLNEELTAVNINTAGVEELMALEGIGEKLAERIIAYREENGAFDSPQDITLVPGIGDGIYSKICANITT